MNKINNKLRYFKSAVAFFFLFLLHGTSIRNGQQGISYNSEIYASLNVKSNIRNETHKENMQRKGQRIRKWLW